MKRYLFELTAYIPAKGVERRSQWVSDDWLANQLTHDPNLDRIVAFQAGHFPLPQPPLYHPFQASTDGVVAKGD